jgi:hypothetical protein
VGGVNGDADLGAGGGRLVGVVEPPVFQVAAFGGEQAEFAPVVDGGWDDVVFGGGLVLGEQPGGAQPGVAAGGSVALGALGGPDLGEVGSGWSGWNM